MKSKSNPFSKFEKIIKETITSLQTKLPSGIFCFISNHSALDFTSAMPRSPQPPTGAPVDKYLDRCILAAIEINASVHDGAVIFSFNDQQGVYKVFGWSYRLYPPFDTRALLQNRGSAFYSSGSMSLAPGVDAVVSWSGNEIWCHEQGTPRRLSRETR